MVKVKSRFCSSKYKRILIVCLLLGSSLMAAAGCSTLNKVDANYFSFVNEAKNQQDLRLAYDELVSKYQSATYAHSSRQLHPGPEKDILLNVWTSQEVKNPHVTARLILLGMIESMYPQKQAIHKPIP